MSYDELLAIRDIGPVGAEEVADFVADNRDMLERLFAEVSPTLPEVAVGSKGKLAGKSFCVTGSFESMSRDEIHALVEANGGEVRTSVSPKLDYLIAGADAGSKLEKARSLGVPVIGREEFDRLVS